MRRVYQVLVLSIIAVIVATFVLAVAPSNIAAACVFAGGMLMLLGTTEVVYRHEVLANRPTSRAIPARLHANQQGVKEAAPMRKGLV